MRQAKKVWSLLFSGMLVLWLAACTDSSDSVIDPGTEEGENVKIDSVKVVDPETGDTVVRVDTLERSIDSVRTIDPVSGDTIYMTDTIYVPKDTTLHWVGNSALVITEISPLNLTWYDEDGDDGSWVEIYNAGNTAANLKGYSLVENLKSARKWVFGDELIAAKSFRTVFCDKKNLSVAASGTDSDAGHYRTHTNWKMDKDGGTVYLIDAHYGIRDSVAYPEINAGDVSWGIVDGGGWKYFDKPTPEAPNTESTAYDGFVPTLDMSSIKGGFYNDAVTLNPPSVSDGMKVRCTQDGSEPTSSSQEFNSTITIDKNTVLRCAVFKDGLLSKKVTTNTFFIGETVAMPVVAISVDPEFFTKHYIQPRAGSTNAQTPEGAPAGLYEDVEYPVHVEYFEKGSSSTEKAFEIEAGISLMGNYSRLERKKSVAVVMREEYQQGWLNYPLFETRKGVNDKYKGFNLRNNGNRFVSDYFEDALGGAILEGSDVDYQRSRQVVVFYNGVYYGIHDMRERYNKNYVETNYGIEASTVNIIKHLDREVTASNGTTADYQALLAYVASNDFSGENNASYDYVKGLMDVGNFADYIAAEVYIHNGDWPNNNVRAWRSPEQSWKFMIYDLDHGFDWTWSVSGFGQSTNMFSWIEQGGYAGNKCYQNATEQCFHTFYVKLIKNPDFKRLFINRSAVMLQNYLNASTVESVRKTMADQLVSSETSRDLEYNGQKDRGYGSFTVSNSNLTSWAEERDTEIVSQYKSKFGLGDMVSMTIAASGNGYVLMEGMKLPGNGTYSGKFFGGNTMELTAVPTNGAVFTGWSDGATENPHTVSIAEGLSVSANFK